MGLKQLIQKYNVAGPRYTSYPTAPVFTDSLGTDQYRKALAKAAQSDRPLAFYVHIPFCESLCYYCGCNIQITKDRARGPAYVELLLKELESVSSLIGRSRSIQQISWGGGTPTFLTVADLRTLYNGIRNRFPIADGAEISLEVDPRVTSVEQLEALREMGFNRVSLGVQDTNSDVQKAVNRIQPGEMTSQFVERARGLGFRGINLDLIYGLPLQTLGSFEQTIDDILRIKPDRLALYNYAHLPSLRPHQKILEKKPMPSAEERVDIFSMAYDRLLAEGYHAIGMDHFALEEDELFKAVGKGTLYRNFMGYTVKRGSDLIGVGASAIGEVGDSYWQNVRETKPYEERIQAGGLAAFRGCLLTQEDLRRKWVIQRLMCQFALSKKDYENEFKESFDEHFSSEVASLDHFYDDAILEHFSEGIKVTALGRLFLRNVAMVFDEYLKTPKSATFSRTV